MLYGALPTRLVLIGSCARAALRVLLHAAPRRVEQHQEAGGSGGGARVVVRGGTATAVRSHCKVYH